MSDFIKNYLMAITAAAITTALVVFIIWAYGWFVEREMKFDDIRVQEYVGKDGVFTVFYSCERGVTRVDYAPGDGD